ncbi:hypothetical protein [Lapidilactobacillus salsurivasis]
MTSSSQKHFVRYPTSIADRLNTAQQPPQDVWLSGEIILSDLSLRIRPDFETSRGLCGLAQNSAHRVPATTNVLRRLRPHQTHQTCNQEQRKATKSLSVRRILTDDQ